MQPHEVTWALVALAGVQTIHAIFTAWFAAMESKCQRQLRLVKHEIANMRQQISVEGVVNRHAIEENRKAIVDCRKGNGGGGSDTPPPAP